MAATNSPPKTLLKQLRTAYPDYQFSEADDFYWQPNLKTIFYNAAALSTPEGLADLLHELGHALLQHQQYEYDITLIQMEAAAWEQARELARQWHIPLGDTYADDSLATYQEWLAGRSACPHCNLTGIQQNKYTYQCLNCRCMWRVNDAKFCELRRYRLIKQQDQTDLG